MMLRRPRVQDDGGMLSMSHVPHVAHNTVDTQDLRHVYEEYLPVIYRFVYSKVGNREEAEDLTSQVFVKAIRSLDGARDPQSVQSWLFQVARTTIADHWREFYRLRPESLDDLLAAGWEAPAVDTIDAVQALGQSDERVGRILSHLSPRYRDVLIYRFLYSYSIRETAEKMGLSEANVKVLQFRALKKAAEDEHIPEPPAENLG